MTVTTNVGISGAFVPKSNTTATTAPGVSDDVSLGYSVGSHWSDITADLTYVCIDATAGAAIWSESAGGASVPTVVTINAQTGASYTLVLTDNLKLVTMTNGSANTLTIPTNASVAFALGTRIEVVMGGAGVTTITGDTGVTVNGVSAGSGAINTQYQGVVLTKIATNTWLASGDIATVA